MHRGTGITQHFDDSLNAEYNEKMARTIMFVCNIINIDHKSSSKTAAIARDANKHLNGRIEKIVCS